MSFKNKIVTTFILGGALACPIVNQTLWRNQMMNYQYVMNSIRLTASLQNLSNRNVNLKDIERPYYENPMCTS